MDLKEFEKILRTETGEELETEEIRMVQDISRFFLEIAVRCHLKTV